MSAFDDSGRAEIIAAAHPDDEAEKTMRQNARPYILMLSPWVCEGLSGML